MIKTYCDRCGVEIPDDAPNNAPRKVTISGGSDVELCNDCTEELQTWVNTPPESKKA